MDLYSIDADKLSPKERYQYLIASVAPRPIAFVSTISAKGVTNLAPFSFFNAFGSNPPIIGFSVGTKPDATFKDTLVNILETHECVVNVVNYDIVDQMNITAGEFEKDISEFEASKLTALASDLVKPPRVSESVIQMECKVRDVLHLADKFESLINDEPEIEAIGGRGNLVLCEILKWHIDPKLNLKREGAEHMHIDPSLLDIAGRNGRAYYTRSNVDSIFELKKN